MIKHFPGFDTRKVVAIRKITIFHCPPYTYLNFFILRLCTHLVCLSLLHIFFFPRPDMSDYPGESCYYQKSSVWEYTHTHPQHSQRFSLTFTLFLFWRNWTATAFMDCEFWVLFKSCILNNLFL